jgi:hypothetical protein
MEKPSKKELKESYKNRTVIGGIYCIKCNENGHMWIKSTKDMVGQKNKFEFFLSTHTCPEPGMYKEWSQYGAQSFSFDILEEINKGETQTDREFSDDIDVLFHLWLDKQEQEEII